ncbi:histidinol-phosphate transaminase [Virgibacillus dakarensis]|uniref:histidinol-phosphate transaminase n=1 Tax=Virgibacillus dakarensis TaxID=1917889 RepID=UPI000B438EED|nr:histidinol-phosphate transaminase [Virgibacillus dakarensis]MBT2214792.1 histidinol-phosphate transaminase [Virgibacillus dakarensis]
MSELWSKMALRADPYVPGEQMDGKGIIKLNTNENPYPPSPHVAEAITQELDRKLNLYPSPTADSLRETIAAHHQLVSENIFVGNGSDEVLAFAFMAFFDPGKAIRFPAITYSFYPVYARLFDIPYETVPLDRDFSITTSSFFQSDGGVIFPNPNAPTGIYLELEHVADIAKNNAGRVAIIDEAYIDFAGESAVSLINTYDNLLVVQTMSKSRSLAGLRIGYALGNAKLIEALTRIKNSFNSYTLDRLAIVGAEAAIRDQQYFVQQVERIVQTREWVTKRLKQNGFTVLPSQANFIFASHYKLSAKLLYEKLKRNGVLVRYFDKPEIDNYLRITIGTDTAMTVFFEKLGAVIAELVKDGVHARV